MARVRGQVIPEGSQVRRAGSRMSRLRRRLVYSCLELVRQIMECRSTAGAALQPCSNYRNYTAAPVRCIGGLSRRRFTRNGHPLRTHEIRPAQREVFMGANDRPREISRRHEKLDLAELAEVED